MANYSEWMRSVPRTKEDAHASLQKEILAETANALGMAGQRLETCLTEIKRYDRDVELGILTFSQTKRDHKVALAGEAFWGYVVQRELLGLHDAEYIGVSYQVPKEVWKKMGPIGTR